MAHRKDGILINFINYINNLLTDINRIKTCIMKYIINYIINYIE